jgi:alanine dehydrogenase
VRAEATLLLQRSDVARWLTFEDCIAAVEQAFRLLGEERAAPPGILGMHCRDGGFHIKAGFLDLKESYFAAKVNANFPGNPVQFGLPTIQGAIVLCSASDGRLLATMDSGEITARRTAAASAVAAKYLARPNSSVITICGCGCQARAQVRALARIFSFGKLYAHDARREEAERFATEIGEELAISAEAVAELGAAVRESDICVTCTTSHAPFLRAEDLAPGTFVAAVGADNPEKSELHPEVLRRNKVVVDMLEQCANIGDLHHAIAAGLLDKEDVHAELGQVVAGKRVGRISNDEIVIFDSTGIALQDVAAAAVVYEKALEHGAGKQFDFAA